MAAPVAPSYYLSVGLDATDIGILLAAFGVTFLVSEALWGFAVGKLSNRSTIGALIVVSGLASLVYTVPQPFTTIILVQPISAVAFGGIGIFSRVTVSQMSDSGGKGRAFGYLGLVFSLGSVAGSLLGGLVSSDLGISGTFLAGSIVTLASLAVLPFTRITPWKSRTQDEAPVGGEPIPRPLLRGSELAVLAAIAPTTAMCSAFFSLLLPNILVQTQSFPVGVIDVSILIASFNVAAGAFQPVMGSIGSKTPRRWIIGGLAACGLAILLLSRAQSIFAVDAITLAAGVANSSITPLSLLLLSSGLPSSRMAKALGLYGAAEDLGIIIGGSIGGFIWAFFGETWVFFVLSGILFSISALYLIVARRNRTAAL